MAAHNRRTHTEFKSQVYGSNGTKYVEILGRYVNSNTKVKVRYVACGHVGEIHPTSLLRGVGCGTCAKTTVGDKLRKSNLTFGKELEKLHGKSLVPLSEYEGNKKKMTFYHVTCGEVFTRTPSSILRSGAEGCKICSLEGRIRSSMLTHKEFIEEIDKLYPANEFTFLESYKGYTVPIECVHNNCGKVARRKPRDILKGRRCAHCSKVYSPTTEEFKERVRIEFNGEYEVVGEYKTAKTRTEILHIECGRTFLVSPDNLLRGRKCSNCKASSGEIAVRNVLIEKDVEFEEEKRFGGKDKNALRYDFHIPEYNAYIEYDGEQHFEPFKHWGGDEALKRTQFRDGVKDANCRLRGFPLLRIPYWEFDNISEIVTEFIEELEEERKKRKEDDLLDGE